MLGNYLGLLTLIVMIQFLLPTGIVPLIGGILILQSSFLAPNVGLTLELAAALTFPISKCTTI